MPGAGSDDDGGDDNGGDQPDALGHSNSSNDSGGGGGGGGSDEVNTHSCFRPFSGSVNDGGGGGGSKDYFVAPGQLIEVYFRTTSEWHRGVVQAVYEDKFAVQFSDPSIVVYNVEEWKPVDDAEDDMNHDRKRLRRTPKKLQDFTL